MDFFATLKNALTKPFQTKSEGSSPSPLVQTITKTVGAFNPGLSAINTIVNKAKEFKPSVRSVPQVVTGAAKLGAAGFQGAVRSGINVVQGVDNVLTGDKTEYRDKPISEVFNEVKRRFTSPTYTPISKVEQKLTGKTGQFGFKTAVVETEKTLTDFGASEKAAKKWAMPLVMIGSLADMFPGGNSAKDGAIKAIANNSDDVVGIIKTLKNVFKMGKEADEIAPTLLKINDPTLVQKTIESFIEGKIKAGKDLINIPKLDINDQGIETVKEGYNLLRKNIEENVGRPITDQEVIDEAAKIKNIFEGAFKNREEQKAYMAQGLRLRQEMARLAQTGKIDDNFLNLLERVKEYTSEGARVTQKQKIKVIPGEDSNLLDFIEKIKKMGIDATETLRLAKEQDVDFNDPNQAASFFRKFIKTNKIEDWIDILRYNAMLSSPSTQIVNIASNLTGVAGITPLTKTIAGGVDFLRSAATGKAREQFAGEGAAYLRGFLNKRVVSDAIDRFSKSITGKTNIGNMDLRRLPITDPGTAGRSVEDTLSFPGRLMEAFDQFFQTLAREGNIASLQYRVKKGGKLTDDILTTASEEAQKILFRNKLVDQNEGQILQGVGSLANTLNKFRRSDNVLLRTIGRWTLPFIQTPTNILKTGLEYNPITGPLTIIGAKNKNEQIAKSLIGLGTVIGLSTIMGQDRLTFSEPKDATAKADFRSSGRQAYSIKIGDNWYSYQKVHPSIAFNFAIMAALDQAIREKKLDEDAGTTLFKTITGFGGFIYDQSYMRSIGDFVAGAQGDAEGAAKLMSNYAQQLIPFRAMLGWISKIIDDTQRKPNPSDPILKKQMQYVMMQIPGLSQNVPPRVDGNGEPISAGDFRQRIINAFSPVRISEVDQSKEAALIATQDVRKFNSQQRKIYNQQSAQIDTFITNLKGMDKEAKINAIRAFGQTNPLLVERLIDKMQSRARNLSTFDKQIEQLSIKDGDRAQFLFEYMNKNFGNDAQKRKAFILDLVEKKVVKEETLRQLLELKNKQE